MRRLERRLCGRSRSGAARAGPAAPKRSTDSPRKGRAPSGPRRSPRWGPKRECCAIADSPDSLAETDRAAWDLLIRSLTSAERFATPQGAKADRYDAEALLELLLDVLQSERLPEPTDEVGRVRVLSPTSVRALSIPYLFVAGLTEQAFPAPTRGDRLYSEAEYERLFAAGLPVVLRGQRSQEEMLLFYEVVTRATRRLCLSYPGLDEKAQPLLPSPYLIELEQALGGDAKHFQLDDLSPIPRDNTPTGATDERVLAMAHALELREARGADPLATLAQLSARTAGAPIADNLIAGLAAMGARAMRERVWTVRRAVVQRRGPGRVGDAIR